MDRYVFFCFHILLFIRTAHTVMHVANVRRTQCMASSLCQYITMCVCVYSDEYFPRAHMAQIVVLGSGSCLNLRPELRNTQSLRLQYCVCVRRFGGNLQAFCVGYVQFWPLHLSGGAIVWSVGSKTEGNLFYAQNVLRVDLERIWSMWCRHIHWLDGVGVG